MGISNGTRQQNILVYMSNYRIYKDSKEIPLWNYKRILQTEDFFYMIKGYEPENEIEFDVEELKLRFDQIQQETVLSLNEKNYDFSLYAKLEKAKLELSMYALLIYIIDLKIKETELCKQAEMEIDMTVFKSLLSQFQIEKNEDLSIQKDIVQSKITRYENEISDLASKIKIPEQSDIIEFDIDEQIINVKIGLETDFDEHKTSVHQYQVYIKLLIKKIEQQSKIRNK